MKYSKFLWLVRKEMERRIRYYKENGVTTYFMCNAADTVHRQQDSQENYRRLISDVRGLLGGYGTVGQLLAEVYLYGGQWQVIQFIRYFLRRLHNAALLEEKQQIQSLKGKKNECY